MAVHAMETFLLANNKILECTEDEMEEAILRIAKGKIAYQDLSKWIESHIYR